MKKLLALIGARNKEFYRDRSALVWTLLFPFIVLCGFTYGYSGKQDPVLRVMLAPAATPEAPLVRQFMSAPGIEFTVEQDEESAKAKLGHYSTDLLLIKQPGMARYAYFIN